MAKYVTVLTLKAIEHQGQNHRAGVVISLPVLEALLLARERKVTLSSRAIREAQTPLVVPVAPVPRAPAPVPEPVMPQTPELEADADLETKPKRRYKRRDLEAEDSSTLSTDSDEDR